MEAEESDAVEDVEEEEEVVAVVVDELVDDELDVVEAVVRDVVEAVVRDVEDVVGVGVTLLRSERRTRRRS